MKNDHLIDRIVFPNFKLTDHFWNELGLLRECTHKVFTKDQCFYLN